MKKAIYIIAGLAVLVVTTLAGVVIWIFNKQVKESNKTKTEAARAARWRVTPEGDLKTDVTDDVIKNEDENKN